MDSSAPSPSASPPLPATAQDALALLDLPPPPGAMDAPAARRNAAPLLRVLLAELPPDGTVLEIGSGTGQHALVFANALKPRLWQPTEMDPLRRDSIRAWASPAVALPADALPAVALPPRALDASSPAETWPVSDIGPVSAMVSVNVIHIAPWAVALGLFAGAARWLPPGAPLLLYGPFARDGQHTSAGNSAFDAQLRAETPSWGLRDLEREVVPAADAAGLGLAAIHPMPANNLTVVLRKR